MLLRCSPRNTMNISDPIRAARLQASTQPPPWIQKSIEDPQPWGYIIYHTQEWAARDCEIAWCPAYVAEREEYNKPQPYQTCGREQIAALKVMEWSNPVVAEAATLTVMREYVLGCFLIMIVPVPQA